MTKPSKFDITEYDKKMREYRERLDANYTDELYEEVSQFQEKEMTKMLEEYRKTIDEPAKEVIANLVQYAINISESGNAIESVETEEEANRIDEILWDEIGDLLLDCEIYEEDGEWNIDVMFGGYYVPYWDGWRD
jgi:glutamyl-tRNA reductase